MSVAFLFNKYSRSIRIRLHRRRKDVCSFNHQPATEFSVAGFFITFTCHSERSEE
jgi:hypothetical protein